MKKTTKSTLLLTATTRHSQELFDSANLKTKSRINLLATTGSSQLRYPPIYRTINPEQPQPAPNMNARIAKMSFQFELILQDIQSQQLQLKSSRQYLNRINHQINKSTNQAFTSLMSGLIELEGGLAKQVAISKERTKQLNRELDTRKQKFEHVRNKMGLIGIRLKRLEDVLGTYTGNDKMGYC